MNELREHLISEFADHEYAHAYLEENSNMRIAAQVRALRLQRGWSQQELADRAMMRQERISKIEMGDFDSLTLKTLRRLGQAFDVHLAVVFISVGEAIDDFLNLSKRVLECKGRDESLRDMKRSTSTISFRANQTPQSNAMLRMPGMSTSATSTLVAIPDFNWGKHANG